jgi:hypothetical protein
VALRFPFRVPPPEQCVKLRILQTAALPFFTVKRCHGSPAGAATLLKGGRLVPRPE